MLFADGCGAKYLVRDILHFLTHLYFINYFDSENVYVQIMTLYKKTANYLGLFFDPGGLPLPLLSC